DSIKFQYLGKILGICHPTGYPLYLGISHLFSKLPISTLAFRANFLSYFFALLALGLFYGLACRLSKRPVLAAALTMFWGLSPAFWLHACVAEVYSLHCFLFLLVLWAVFWWDENPCDSRVVWVLAAVGLSLLHHLLTVTVLPAIAYWGWERRRVFKNKTLLWGALGGVLACIWLVHGLYYLRIGSQPLYMDSAVNGIAGYLSYIRGGDFQSQLFVTLSPYTLVRRMLGFGNNLRREWFTVFFFFAVFGYGWALWTKDRRGLFLTLVFAAWFVLCSQYQITDISQYYMHGTLVTGLLLAVVFQRQDGEQPTGMRWGGVALALVCAISGLISATCIPQELVDYKRFEPDVMEDVLKQAPPGALLVPQYYRFEQLLNYYSTVHNDWDQDTLLFMLHEKEIHAYLKEGKPLEGRGKVIQPGHPVYVFTFLDRFDPAVFQLTPLPIPPASRLAETLTDRFAQWPVGSLVAVVSNNQGGDALTAEACAALTKLGAQGLTPGALRQFTGVFCLTAPGEGQGKSRLGVRLSVCGVEAGDWMNGRQVPVRIVCSSLVREGGAESYIEVDGERYVPNRYGLSFVVIDGEDGSILQEITVDTATSSSVWPYGLVRVE
ncbi:MAG: DUF2723 domain-containing protein, partial [bacterium]|nr:DUF2723 domain-containing protein [bacterium]